MASRTSSSSGSERISYPTKNNEQPVVEKTEDAIAAAADWNSGMAHANENESESIVINSSDLSDENEFSSVSENSSASDASERDWANRAATKMNTRHTDHLKEGHSAANTAQPHKQPSKFCLTGTGTSLGFTAAVAGFTATAFRYDLMTRFPEKATTEIGVAFGASIAIALGGTITCSTSMVFMIRELCKTSSE